MLFNLNVMMAVRPAKTNFQQCFSCFSVLAV